MEHVRSKRLLCLPQSAHHTARIGEWRHWLTPARMQPTLPLVQTVHNRIQVNAHQSEGSKLPPSEPMEAIYQSRGQRAEKENAVRYTRDLSLN
jgi:hypothetical protein